MKKRHILFLPIAFLFLFHNGHSQSCQNNILTNPDFEAQNISGWSGAGIYAENNLGRYISVCTNNTAAYQTKSATAGITYNLSVQAFKSFNDSQGIIGLKFLSSSWQVLQSDYFGITSSSFASISTTKTAPAGTAYVEVSLTKTGGSGCVNADNWCLTSGGGGGNPCAITSSLVSVNCLDNGTPNEPLDDRYEFSVLVEKTGDCGGSWFDFTTGQTGNYGVPTTFASVPTTLNSVNVVIGDTQSPTTAAPLLIQSPGPCSNGGGGTCTNNLLADPGFTNATNWLWTSPQAINIVTGANAFNGNTIEICGASERIYQTVNVTSGKTYTLQAQTRRTQNASGLLVIKYLDASWTPLAQEFIPANNNTYALVSGSLAAPAGAVRAEISFYHNGGTGCVYADDFCFSENGGTPCVLSSTITNVQCDDLGTNDPNDDIFSADLTVTGGSSATYLYTVPNLSGGGGNPFILTGQKGVPTTISFNIASFIGQYGNTFLLGGEESGNPNCTFSETLQIPPPCSNSGSACGFHQTYTNSLNTGLFGAPSATELPNGGGYKVFSQRIALSPTTDTDYNELTIDQTGAQTNYVYEDVSGVRYRTLDGMYIAGNFTNNSTIELKKTNASGASVGFTKNVSFTSPITTFFTAPRINKILSVSDGYIILIYYAYQPVPNQAPVEVYSIVKTDLNGNKIAQAIGDPIMNYPTNYADFLVGNSGNYYLVVGNSSNYILIKYNATGTKLWEKSIVSDLPSSDYIQTHEASDGHVFTTRYDNLVGYVRKLNATNGNQIWEFNASFSIPIPVNSLLRAYPYGSLSTPDGGAVFSMRYNDITNPSTNNGTVIGRLDNNGNLMWYKTFPVAYEYQPVLNTSDGGFLFAGVNADNIYGILKTTGAGEILPDCGGGTSNQADLTMENLNVAGSSAAVGSVLNFNFDLKNIGNAATSNYTIKSYLSTDNVLSANDIQDGVIPTGNLGAGQTVSQTPGALTVPVGTTPGNYYVILKVDADNQITESNENNNVLVSASQIAVTSGGGTGADLKVTITADKTTVPQWGNVTYTVTAKNEGSQAIASAEIAIGICGNLNDYGFDSNTGLVYAGIPAAPTAGTYDYLLQTWNLTNLAPGQTGTLTIPLFTLNTAERKVLAWTTAQSPNDPDSQPSPSPMYQTNPDCTVLQDDEAIWTINAGQILKNGNKTALDDSQKDWTAVDDYQLFPNPAGESVFLKLPASEMPVSLTIFNQVGILEKTISLENTGSGPSQLNLSDLKNGVYFLHISTPLALNGGQKNRPIVKKLVVSRMY